MRPWTAVPRPLLYMLAVLFCAATTLYSCVWMYDGRQLAHPVELGFNLGRDTVFRADTKSIPVDNVAAGSPAERAGLRPGDEIVGLNGEPVTSYAQFDRIWTNSYPGDPVDVTVRRPNVRDPVTLHAVFRAAQPDQPAESLVRSSVEQIVGLYPFFFCWWVFPCSFSGLMIPWPGCSLLSSPVSLPLRVSTTCRSIPGRCKSF